MILPSLLVRDTRTDGSEVTVTGARPFYDLTNPVIYQRDEAIVKDETDEKAGPLAPKVPRRSGESEASYRCLYVELTRFRSRHGQGGL